MLILYIFAILFYSNIAYAYIGPGIGVGLLLSILVFIFVIILLVLFSLFYPIKFLFSKFKKKKD